MGEDSHTESLKLERINGFNGTVLSGLIVHPDNEHLVYPLGCNIIIEHQKTNKQHILSKHTDNITCLVIDPTGNFIASGQQTYSGFIADIILWDYHKREVLFKDSLHKVKIEALAFTKDSDFLIGLGGADDGAVAVWSLKKKERLCGNEAQKKSAGVTLCLETSMADNYLFVTGGTNTLCVWRLDVPNRKIMPTDVNLGGSIKRTVICIKMADEHLKNPPLMFCGTESGDILGVHLKTHLMQFIVPTKNQFSLGVTALSIVCCRENIFDFLIGTGDGKLGRYELTMNMNKNKTTASLKAHAGVKIWEDPHCKSKITSIAKRGGGHMFFVGTANCQMYRFNLTEMTAKLMKTCHSSEIKDIIFPFGTSELFVTCQHEEVRVWDVKTGNELRRCVIPNMTCNAICISRDGRNLFSAWNDRQVRVIGFDNATEMKQLWSIKDTHIKEVTAIAITSDARRLITGGGEGQVRVWQIDECMFDLKKSQAKLLATMKEHTGEVQDIQIHPSDTLCVSASSDGTTIIWNLEKYSRKEIVFANTLFKCVVFGRDAVHILTSGTDRKITYWEVLDGSIVRELEGSQSGAINTLDMSSDGNMFITGGEEKLLKLWTYAEGEVTHVGCGHGNQITKAKICPNRRIIVSVGTDGAILVWKYPQYCKGRGTKA